MDLASRLADRLATAPAVRGVRPPGPDEIRVQRRVMLVATIVPFLGLVLAMLLLWGRGLSGVDLGLLLGFYAFTGFGITAGYHRLFTHRSFDAPRPVKLVFAVAGGMALQGSLISWVKTHRRHHAYTDEYGDPHSPYIDAAGGARGILAGLWHAHAGWLFAPDGTDEQQWAPDLANDPLWQRVDRAFPLLALVTFTLPALLGGLLTMSFVGAVSGFVWGGLVRVFLLHHVTWSINSICHFYGSKPFDSHDESRNNLIMALLAFGEGWHNAHHAFPASARHGLRWWEVDTSWMLIRTLSWLRLARDIKLPSPRQLARKRRAAPAMR